MSTEHSDVTPGPDEFDRQLRDLYAGTAGAARFREPSAAERAKRAARRRRAALSPRKASQAGKLRQSVAPASPARPQPSRPRRWLGPLARGRSGPARRPAPGDRRRRLIKLARGAGILVGFVALLFLLHALGLGPQ